MKPIISDDRTAEEKEKTIGFVVATDKFMSGWGQAPGRSIIAVPFVDDADRRKVLLRIGKRSEMIRVREVSKDYKPKLNDGDHLHIYDTTKSFRYSL